MEGKKKIKISFGTAICICIIIMLLIALIVAVSFKVVKNRNQEMKASITNANETSKINVNSSSVNENSQVNVNSNSINENVTELEAKKELPKVQTYKIELNKAENSKKVEKVINSDFTLYFNRINGDSEEQYSWEISVNGNVPFYSEYVVKGSAIEDWLDEITIYTYGNYLFYTNHDYTDIRGGRLFVVNNKGELVKDIYEFDENDKGLVLSKFNFENNYLLVEANRLSHGPSIVAEKYSHMVEVESEMLLTLPTDLIVEATYKYAFTEDGSIDFNNPEVINSKTLLQYLEKDKDLLYDKAKEMAEKYITINTKSISNNTNESAQIELQKSGYFTIKKIEENENNYKISVHMLEEERRKVTRQEYDNVLNGGTIRFRGREWVYSKADDYEGIILKEKNTQNEWICINKIENKDYYGFYDRIGDGGTLKDYKSDELTVFNVDKDIKVGDTFEAFEYDSSSSTVIVKTFEGKNAEQSETSTREFLSTFNGEFTIGHYGECIAYTLNGKIVAIQTFKATGP